MKRMYCIIMTVFLLFVPGAAFAADIKDVNSIIEQIPSKEWPESPKITSEAAILLEANSGTILYAKNATQKMYPASTTKLMTALLTTENCKLDDIITFSSKSVLSLEPGSSHIGMRVGEKLNVKDCLYGLMLPSANEVANALAEHISGSIDAFISHMNDRAARLGTINTQFSNPNGLYDENHYSCAYDLCLIMQACIKQPGFLDVASRPTYVRQPDELLNKQIPMASTNNMIRPNKEYYDPDVICGKTGWTQEAGRCLVTYASKNGMDLICVTMKTEEPNQFIDTKTLLDYGFDQFSTHSISQIDTAFDSSHLSADSPLHFKQSTKELVSTDASSKITLPNGVDIQQLKRHISKEDEESGPVITYLYQDYPLGSASILPVKSGTVDPFFPDKTGLPQELTGLSVQPMIVINIWLVVLCTLLVFLLIGDLVAIKRHSRYAVTPAKVKKAVHDLKNRIKRK